MSGRPVEARRDSGELVNADEVPFTSMLEAVAAVRIGNARKRYAATAMNDRSSRSHTILLVTVTQHRTGSDSVVRTSLHMVDLAGSERIKKSKAVGGQVTEAIGINSSLLVLGRVISALVEAKSHVPYLESKLTVVLRSAFGGNSRTTILVSCRSDSAHGDETLHSLRFGERCGMISNTAKVAATSLSGAIALIDASLLRVEEQLKTLEARGMRNQNAYLGIKASYARLTRRRQELLKENFQ